MKFAKVMFSQVSFCSNGGLGLCPGGSLSMGLCPGGLCLGVPVQRGSLPRGPFPGGFCLGSLCQGRSLSWGLCPGRVSVQGVSVWGMSLSRGASVQRVSVWGDLCPVGLCHGVIVFAILLTCILVITSFTRVVERGCM